MKRWRYDKCFFRASPAWPRNRVPARADVIQHGGRQHLGAGPAAPGSWRMIVAEISNHGVFQPVDHAPEGRLQQSTHVVANGDPASADPLPAPWSAGNPGGAANNQMDIVENGFIVVPGGKVSSESSPMINASRFVRPSRSWRHSCSVCAVQEGYRAAVRVHRA